MAVIIRRIFGNPSGKFGQSIFRSRYGKIVAYSKPANQRVSKSVAAKEARKQFALTVAFAKIINGSQFFLKYGVMQKCREQAHIIK
ncbi:MAG: hypothetical protein WAV89_05680 [Ignavibacteriaceae bacterium]